MLDTKLLDILCCPKCKYDLECIEKDQKLICHKCKLSYDIEDGIPIMLVDKAVSIE